MQQVNGHFCCRRYPCSPCRTGKAAVTMSLCYEHGREFHATRLFDHEAVLRWLLKPNERFEVDVSLRFLSQSLKECEKKSDRRDWDPALIPY